MSLFTVLSLSFVLMGCPGTEGKITGTVVDEYNNRRISDFIWNIKTGTAQLIILNARGEKELKHFKWEIKLKDFKKKIWKYTTRTIDQETKTNTLDYKILDKTFDDFRRAQLYLREIQLFKYNGADSLSSTLWPNSTVPFSYSLHHVEKQIVIKIWEDDRLIADFVHTIKPEKSAKND